VTCSPLFSEGKRERRKYFFEKKRRKYFQGEMAGSRLATALVTCHKPLT
jgi:hypothetical protein